MNAKLSTLTPVVLHERQRVCAVCHDVRCNNGTGGAMLLHERAYTQAEVHAALATIRAEVWNDAIKIAKAEAFERRMAYCVVDALESARAGKVEG